jgi:CRP-like cAMP-binding protein
VSAAAVDTFIEVGSSITPLIHSLADASDPRLAKMAAFILCRINPREHSALVRAQIDDTLLSIYGTFGQLAVLSPLAEGGNDSILVLQKALIEQNQRLIDNVFWLLGAIHPPSDVSIVVESLHSQTYDVRANAAEALEALTSPQMAGLISPLFDPELSSAQLLKLGQEAWDITPGNAKQVLRKLVTHANVWWLRAIAVFALGEMATRLIPHAAEPKQQMQNRSQRRRRPPADLLGKLVDADTPRAEKQDQLPGLPKPDTVAGGLALTEIKDLIRIARGDRDPQVRSSAQAAERTMEGPPTIERARKEGFLLSTIEKIIAMKKVPFFQGMTIEQLNALANVCEEMLYESGTRIFEQGDPGGALYVVVSGRVSIERAGQRRGSVVQLATIEANAYFGEMSLFNRDSRSAAAVTIQDTLLLRLRREPLLVLLRRYPGLSVELINVLSQRLRDASDRIAQLTRSRPRELQKLYDKLG